MASLQGMVYALTGAASGIGLATARILAARGASLGLADLNEAGLDSAAKGIETDFKNPNVITAVVDVRDRDSVAAFLAKTKGHFGRLDGCGNIAGAIGKHHHVHRLWELSGAEFDFVMDVNVKGVFNCLAEQLKPGVLSEGAAVVNAGSVCSYKGVPGSSAYCASKHAVLGLTRVAAIEAGSRGIRVNIVAPGTIDTPMLAASNLDDVQKAAQMSPLPRTAAPGEVGEVIAFLLSRESSFVTGALYCVDGGWSAF